MLIGHEECIYMGWRHDTAVKFVYGFHPQNMRLIREAGYGWKPYLLRQEEKRPWRARHRWRRLPLPRRRLLGRILTAAWKTRPKSPRHERDLLLVAAGVVASAVLLADGKVPPGVHLTHEVPGWMDAFRSLRESPGLRDRGRRARIEPRQSCEVGKHGSHYRPEGHAVPHRVQGPSRAGRECSPGVCRPGAVPGRQFVAGHRDPARGHVRPRCTTCSRCWSLPREGKDESRWSKELRAWIESPAPDMFRSSGQNGRRGGALAAGRAAVQAAPERMGSFLPAWPISPSTSANSAASSTRRRPAWWEAEDDAPLALRAAQVCRLAAAVLAGGRPPCSIAASDRPHRTAPLRAGRPRSPRWPQQLGESLREKAGVEDRLEPLDGQIETFEDIYEMASQRWASSTHHRQSQVVEWLIVAILAAELLVGLVALWRGV